ncbi:hypothetical protein DET55_101374 [Bacillus mycoides]|uniref:Uncharacterized protein n=2 Tax=Bacillaceae TaxID=186817 RepID=A0A3D9VR61_BACMY|nr:hypothetical protein DET63_103374 [Bacillus sp. DB-2]REF41635.1 hypothetical protein DET55_101374 [Bacillus mycoides]
MKEEVTKNLNMNDKEAKARLAEIKKEATKPEEKPVYIRVFESIQRTVSEIFSGAEKRHNGGTLSQTTKKPKYHNGGSPLGLAAHRPKFDEVDARLLKNEMVLTQAQQANLFNELRTANRPSTTGTLFGNKDEKKGENVTKNVVINVAEMNVRDDQDIEKIAQELAYLERSKQRARGI